jgi:hypothetical protein
MRSSAPTWACIGIFLLLGAQSALACSDRQTVWDLALGSKASALPAAFVEYACGTNGGPPSRRLDGFGAFQLCKPDNRGFHEVYFRYDDEQEYSAQALEQTHAARMCGGTQEFGIPVVASALFDGDGVLRAIRLVTDPRGADPADRSDHWALGTMLRHRFGDGWNCLDLPAGAGETPVGSVLIKDECTLSTPVAELTIRREYFHRPGQAFTDEFGVVQPNAFVSETRFEMQQRDGSR